MLQRMAGIYHYPRVWQDFTFPDDVMVGKTVEERARFSSRCVKNFKRRVEREFPEIWAMIRREWETRKSGQLEGEECPHFHALLDMETMTEQNFHAVTTRLAMIWVEVIGTEEREMALRVALHPKSWRWITSRRMAQQYVSKYVAKLEEHQDKCSRGRYWMTLGDLPMEKPVSLPITDSEAVLIRRLFRKKIGNKRSNLYRALRSRDFATWLFVEAVTVKLMLECVRDRIGEEEGRYAPF
jgi:hypothetical protein